MWNERDLYELDNGSLIRLLKPEEKLHHAEQVKSGGDFEKSFFKDTFHALKLFSP